MKTEQECSVNKRFPDTMFLVLYLQRFQHGAMRTIEV
jgi:hypothetical protein